MSAWRLRLRRAPCRARHGPARFSRPGRGRGRAGSSRPATPTPGPGWSQSKNVTPGPGKSQSAGHRLPPTPRPLLDKIQRADCSAAHVTGRRVSESDSMRQERALPSKGELLPVDAPARTGPCAHCAVRRDGPRAARCAGVVRAACVSGPVSGSDRQGEARASTEERCLCRRRYGTCVYTGAVRCALLLFPKMQSLLQRTRAYRDGAPAEARCGVRRSRPRPARAPDRWDWVARWARAQ